MMPAGSPTPKCSIENFVVHPEGKGGQRTDADLLAVRFPFRAERLIDNPEDVMQDDIDTLALSPGLVDVIIAEIKTNDPCRLNGPWTRGSDRNAHRVLAAIGCLPHAAIDPAAKDIYRSGFHQLPGTPIRIRLVAVGRDKSDELTTNYPAVTQLVWTDMLTFIWNRFRQYRRQKTQVDQWDRGGKAIKQLADAHSVNDFVDLAKHLMGVREP